MTKQEVLTLPVGTMVFCKVHAVRGWYRITDIRARDGYIKVDAFNTWNPPYNFSLTNSEGKRWA